MMFVAVGFVALYSLLAHKEVRFLFPTIPLWNLSASIAITEIFLSRRKGLVVSFIRVSVLAAIALGIGITYVSSLASYTNYPGGVAMNALHRLTYQESLERVSNTSSKISVHVDTYAAINGVSRFLEKGHPYMYSKLEGLNISQYKDLGFDYLINEHSNVPGYDLVESVRGFDRIHLCGNGPVPAVHCALAGHMPLTIEQRDRVFIHHKKNMFGERRESFHSV
jgi:alpha-1,6-mannosyltransferase